MQFGIRECTDLVFRSTDTRKIGKQTFKKGQPVLYIDSAKTSTLEGAGTTVYATGGRGNTRLLTWEGEKTLTFTVEDALMSQLGFSILSGAGLFEGQNNENAHFHQMVKIPIYKSTETVTVPKTTYYRWTGESGLETFEEIENMTQEAFNFLNYDETISDNDYMFKLLNAEAVTTANTTHTKPNGMGTRIYAYLEGTTTITANTPFLKLGEGTGLEGKTICANAPIFISIFDDKDNYLGTARLTNSWNGNQTIDSTSCFEISGNNNLTLDATYKAIFDCYILDRESKINELQIDAENFAGYFYVEANTLVKRRSDGKDLPAVITLPKVKIQSNFSIAFASSGDPSGLMRLAA